MGLAGACSKDIAHSLILTLAAPRRATSDSNVQAESLNECRKWVLYKKLPPKLGVLRPEYGQERED